MIRNMPTIGVRFDIKKINEGDYGFACWKIFWQAITPEEIGAAFLYEGDTAASSYNQDKVFCIAVQSNNTGVIGKIKAALRQSDLYKSVCDITMFVEGPVCAAEPLLEAGQITLNGQLVGESTTSRTAHAEIMKDAGNSISTDESNDLPSEVKIIEKNSYARNRLTSHMNQADNFNKLLNDIIDVIDEYSYSLQIRTVQGVDFVEVANNLKQGTLTWENCLKLKLKIPLLAGLKKLVLISDCGLSKDSLPDNCKDILGIRGPAEVDDIIRQFHDPDDHSLIGCVVFLAILAGLAFYGFINH